MPADQQTPYDLGEPGPLREWLDDLRVAAGLLSAVPIPLPPQDRVEIARSARLFSLIGLIIGLAGAVVLALMNWIGLPAAVAVPVALGSMVLVTGGLHEDGLADLCDGFGGGHTKEDILRIMRDSRIGAYGVLGLIFIIGIKWASLAVVAEASLSAAVWAVIGSAALSRGLLPPIMHHVPHAREDGLSVAAGQPGFAHAMTALGVGILAALVAFGFWFGLLLTVISLAVVIGLIAWTSRWLGGQTGDVLGASQQAVETVIFVLAAAAL